MNYDLCDLLNRKMENANGYLPENFPNRSLFKNQNIFLVIAVVNLAMHSLILKGSFDYRVM